jgi:hypothetical protein
MLLLVVCLVALEYPALAGRNANGALVVHTDDSIQYSNTPDYCMTAVPGSCSELNTRTDVPYGIPAVVWLLAAFPDGSSPTVTRIQFGIHHNLPVGEWYFLQARPCGPSPLELPDEGWPEPNDCGNIVAFESPVYDQIFKYYIFGVYLESGQFFGTRTYPSTDEAQFVDDGDPPRADRIYNFGTIRWGAPGENQCPTPPVEEACCFQDGTCLFILASDCDAQGGMTQGPGTTCDPNPCPAYGVCCFGLAECWFIPEAMCEQYGGEYQGDGGSCDPNPCEGEVLPEACCFAEGYCEWLGYPDCIEQGGTPQGLETTCETVICEPVPTENTTWGSIKARFR